MDLVRISLQDPLENYQDVLGFLVKGFRGLDYVHEQVVANWRWRYCDAPAGKGVNSIMIDKDANSRVVCHSAFVPTLCSHGKEDFIAGITGGGITHPDYRRQGIYQILLREEYKVAQDRGISILVDMPNDAARAVMLKVKFRLHQHFEFAWRDLGILGYLAQIYPQKIMRKACLNAMGTLLRERKYDVDLRMEKLDRFGSETDNLWEHVRVRDYVGITKNSVYLNWRYVSKPNTSFLAFMGLKEDAPRALCIIEWLKNADYGIVAELIARNEDEEIARAVLHYAVKQLAKSKIRNLSILIDGSSSVGKIANKEGFYRNGMRPFIARVVDGQSTDKFGWPWRYSMGDYLVASGLWSAR